MGELFQKTENKDIVELSSKDNFWGAYRRGNYAEGYNALGKILMFARKNYYTNQQKGIVTLNLPDVPNIKIFGEAIQSIKLVR